MAKPEHDAYRYLDLLEDYTSRETERVRRNVALISFSVVAVQLFAVPVDQLTIAGVPIVKGKELLVTSVVAVLLVHWSVVFIVRYLADRGRRKERHRLVDDQIAGMRRDYEKMEKGRTEEPGAYVSGDYHALKHVLAKYDEQARRTGFARRMLKVGEMVEWLPTALMALAAAVVIAVRVTRLL